MAGFKSPTENVSESAGAGLRHLIVAASVLHLALSITIFALGRLQVAPAFIDRDGIMPSFAFDSYEYQKGAASLAPNLRSGNLITWVKAPEPIHVKLISISFAVLDPVFGVGPLSAEPFNVLCYLGIICLVFALGCEVADRSVGLVAATTVALWPTLLLHSLQLLKDPLLIIAALGVVFCVATLLTRTYSRRRSAIAGIITAATVLMISRVRFPFAIVIVVLLVFGLGLLVLRQLLDRRLIVWNLLCPVPALFLAAVVLISYHSPRSSVRFKHYPSNSQGEPKKFLTTELQLPGVVRSLPQDRKASADSRTGLASAANLVALRVSSFRTRYAAVYPNSGSVVDGDVDFRDLRGMFSYLPRALEIGLWAPFPNTWTSAGLRVGNWGKLLSAAETALIYIFELLALFAVVWSRRNFAAWLLFAISIFGMTSLGLLVPNIGAIYRFRFPFWLLLIILGIKGLQSLAQAIQLQYGRAGTEHEQIAVTAET